MKNKLATVLFSSTVISLSIYTSLRPSYDLGLFVGLGTTYARVRIVIALVLLSYVLISALRLKIIQVIMLTMGGLLLALGITSIFSPLLFGHLSHYTGLGDMIMALEGGTLSLLAGLQLKTKPLNLPMYFTASYYLNRLPSIRPGKLISSKG